MNVEHYIKWKYGIFTLMGKVVDIIYVENIFVTSPKNTMACNTYTWRYKDYIF